MRIFDYILDEMKDDIRDELFNYYIQEHDDWTEDEIHELIDKKLIQIRNEIKRII